VTVVRIRDPLVGWQEIDEADPADEASAIDDIFGGRAVGPGHGTLGRTFKRGYEHVGFRTAVPISVPAGLQVVRSRVTQVSGGRSREAARAAGTGATPHRVVTQAVLAVDQLPDFPPFVDLNGHLPYRVPDLWQQAHKGWKAVAASYDEYTTLTQRDTNRHGAMPRLAADERQLWPGKGIDRISRLNGRGARRLQVRVTGRRRVRLTIDGHDALGVRLRLTARNGDAVQLWVVTANIGRKYATERQARANIALVRRGFRQL
jgi:hypothetical protein